MEQLENYLLSAVGKSKERIPKGNPYRNLGFDGEKNRLGWVKLPSFNLIHKRLTQLKEILEDKKYFIFVGMGGSINGIKALLTLFKKSNLFAIDSLDPLALRGLLKKIRNLAQALIVPISKSGTTLETQFISSTLKELFASNDWQKHFLCLSDPSSFEKLENLGWRGVQKASIQFDDLEDIGGRFSSPHTLIFFLPLFLLLRLNFKRLEEFYLRYSSLIDKIRKEACLVASNYAKINQAYFYPVLHKKLNTNFSSWIVQLFQESLGSKREAFQVKTAPYFCGPLFNPVGLRLKIDCPLTYLASQMYFFENFIAFYAATKEINFVNQDYVEHYKIEMRRLSEAQMEEDLNCLSLKEIVKEVEKRVSQKHRFLELVLYAHPDGFILNQLKRTFRKAFKQKIVFIFVGSDWNHHSYQAAFADQETFYVFLRPFRYNLKIPPFSQNTLLRNVNTLKNISKATHLTLKDKSLLFSFSER